MTKLSKQTLAGLLLVAALVVFRLIPIYGSEAMIAATANLAPLLAFAFCGGMLLPRKLAIGVTLGAFLFSNAVLNLHAGQSILSSGSLMMIAIFGTILYAGWRLRGRAKISTALLGTAAGFGLFYLVTNTWAFFVTPQYPKSLGGWLQAMTVGLPQYLPTWAFGLRQLASNLLFALAFYLATRPARRPTEAPAVAQAA